MRPDVINKHNNNYLDQLLDYDWGTRVISGTIGEPVWATDVTSINNKLILYRNRVVQYITVYYYKSRMTPITSLFKMWNVRTIGNNINVLIYLTVFMIEKKNWLQSWKRTC